MLHRMLLLAAFFALPWATWAQAISTFPYMESFEASTLPAGWSQSSNLWTTYASGAHAGTQCVAVDGTSYARLSDTLVSPVFDISGLTGATLSFWMQQPDWSGDQNELHVFYRTSATSAWTNLASYTNSIASWTQQTLSLPSPSATYQLAFVGVDAYGHPLLLDEVSVFGLSCPAPMQLQATNVSTSGATLTWTESGTATAWELVVTDLYTNVSTTYYPATATQVLTGLSLAGQYSARLRSICGAGDTSAAATLVFATQSGTITTFPYTCNFTPGFDRTGWAANNTAGSPWVFGTAQNNGADGGGAMYVSADNGATASYDNSTTAANWMSLWFVPDPSALDYLISFDWKAAGESNYDYLCAAVLDSGVAVNYATVQSSPNMLLYRGSEEGSVWQRVSGAATGLTGGPKQLVFLWRNDGSAGNNPAAVVDNVSITAVSCSSPSSAVVSDITADGATLTFHGDAGGSWVLEYATQPFTPATGDSLATPLQLTDTTYTFMGLQPATHYYYSLFSLCGADTGLSVWQGDFYTGCAMLTELPYEYGFEDDAQWRGCWFAGLVSDYPRISSYAHTGDKGLGLYVPAADTLYSYALLPEISDGLGAMTLSFYMRASNATRQGQLQVGYLSDTADMSSFVPVDTLTPNGTQWTSYSVALSDPTQGRIALMGHNTGTVDNYLYVDDVVLDLQSSCPPVVNLTADASNGGVVLLEWDVNQAAATSTPDNFTVTYTDANGVEQSELSDGHSIALVGLLPGMHYTAVVAASCAGEDGTADTVGFTTRNYGCLTSTQGGDTLAVGAEDMTTYAYPTNTYYGYSYTQQLYTPAEMGDSSSILTGIGFKYSHSAASTKSAGVIYLANTSATSLASSFVPFNPSSFVKVYEGTLNCSMGWNHFAFSQSFEYDGVSNLLLVVVDTMPGYDGYSYIFAGMSSSGMSRAKATDGSPIVPANVLLSDGSAASVRSIVRFSTGLCTERLTCFAPTVVVDSLTAQVAYISIADPNGMDPSYNVSYRLASDTTWVTVATDDASTEYEIGGLAMATAYVVRVTSSDCPLAGETEIVTPCADILPPYFNDFTAEPGCWTLRNTGSSPYPAVDNSGTDQGNGLVFYHASWGDSYAVLPPAGVSANTLTLYFDLMKEQPSYVGALEVGVMTNLADNSTFVVLDTVAPTAADQWQPFEVSLAGYADSGAYIAFRTASWADGLYYVYLDNLEVGYAPACASMQQARVSNVTAITADVSWVDDTTASALSHTIFYGTSNDMAAADSVTTTSASPYTLTGLQPVTTYYVWVRMQCAEGSSRALRVAPFTTPTLCMSVENLQLQYNASTSQALLTWSPASTGESATEYIVSHKESSDTTWAMDTVPNTYLRLGGIMGGSDYIFKVTQLCDTSASPENTLTFSAPSCGDVYDLAAETDHTALPSKTNYNYSLAQFIYTAEEMAGVGDTLTSIAFRANSATGMNRVMAVYVANVSQSAYTDETSYIPVDSMTLVTPATGDTVQTTTPGWKEIAFTAPFHRDPSKSLVVMVDDNTGAWSTSVNWAVTAKDDVRALYDYSDDVNPDPAAPAFDYTASVVPFARFGSNCGGVPTCAAPFVMLTGSTQSSVSLQWLAGLSETAWNVDYRAVNDTAWTSVLANTTLTSTTISGLSTGAAYQVRVSPVCAGETLYAYLDVQTQCGAMSVPYTQDFTSQEGPMSLPCWVTGPEGTPAYVLNFPEIGYACLMQGGTYISMPAMNADLRQLAVNFSLQSEIVAPNHYLLVGVCATPGDLSTFTVLDTARPAASMAYSAHLTTLAGYADSVGYITILGSDASTFYVDNITVDYAPTCAAPSALMLNGVTPSTADITWTGASSSYVVEYGPAGFELGTGTQLAAATASVQLTGLVSPMRYDVYVKGVCAGGDTTFWSSPLTFQTACAPIATLPYTFQFEEPGMLGMPPMCWEFAMLSFWYSDPTDYPQVYQGYNITQGGANSLRLYGEAVTALPEVTAAPLDTLMVSFRYYVTDVNDRLQVGVVDSVSEGFEDSFQMVQEIVPTTTGPAFAQVIFANYTGSSNRIAFYNYNADGYEYTRIYIDSLTIDYMPCCVPPVQPHVTSLTTTTATLGWTDATPATQWELAYGTYGTPLDSCTRLTVSANPATISGLTAATRYVAYMRSFCTCQDTSDWAMLEFTTATTDDQYRSLPLEVNFEDASVNNWVTLVNGATNPWVIGTAENADTTVSMGHALYITQDSGATASYDQDAEAVSYAAMDVLLPGGMTNFSYDWKCKGEDGYDFLRIALAPAGTTLQAGDAGDISDNDLPTGWIALDGGAQLANHDTWQHVEDSVATPAGAYRLVLVWNNDMSMGTDPAGVVDNLQLWSAGLRCQAPTVSVATTFESVTLSWTGEATDYEVGVRSLAEATWPADQAVTGTTYTLNGLMPATTYAYRVRAVCSESLASAYAEGTFTTDSLPCFTPTALAATPAFGTAEMSWTAGGEETAWTLHVWNTTFDSMYSVTSNPATIGGLTSGVEYNAAVSALCGGILNSPYGDTISFTTLLCDAVSGVQAHVNGSNVTVSWTAGANNTGNFEVMYGPAGFSVTEGTSVSASEASATLTGLAAGDYEAVVRAKCEANAPSAWSDRVSFSVTVGIDEASASAISIYPNPATSSATISVSGAEGMVSITVIDMDGRVVRSESMECAADCAKTLDVERLASGSYFVRVQGAGINAVRKLVIK